MSNQPNQSQSPHVLDRLSGRATFCVRGELVTPQRAALPNADRASVDVYHLDVRAGFARLPESAVEALRDALLDLVANPPDINWGGLSWSRELVAERQARLAQLPTARQRLTDQLRRLPLAEARERLAAPVVSGVPLYLLLAADAAPLRELFGARFRALCFHLSAYPWVYELWWPVVGQHGLRYLGSMPLGADGRFETAVSLPQGVARPNLWFVLRAEDAQGLQQLYTRLPVPFHVAWQQAEGERVALVVNPMPLAAQLILPPLPGENGRAPRTRAPRTALRHTAPAATLPHAARDGWRMLVVHANQFVLRALASV